MTHTTPQLKAAADAAIDMLLRELPGVKAAVIATEDGFELAGRASDAQPLSRLSAMASSLSALGALAAAEGQMGACDNVCIEMTQGHLLMVRARHAELDLIVCIVAGRNAVFGQVLYMAKRAAGALREA